MHHGKSRVRIVHNVAADVDVDVYVDGRQILSGVPYKAATDYLALSSGDHLVEVNLAGTHNTLLKGLVGLEPNDAYTLVVHGRPNEGLALLALEDNLACPAPGKAHLRFVHAAASVPAVDVWANGNPLFTSVRYGETGEPTYLPVDADFYEVDVTPAGGDEAVLSLDVDLEDRRIYTVIASGLLDDDQYPISAILKEDSMGMCFL
jgi:hypothetical protein